MDEQHYLKGYNDYFSGRPDASSLLTDEYSHWSYRAGWCQAMADQYRDIAKTNRQTQKDPQDQTPKGHSVSSR